MLAALLDLVLPGTCGGCAARVRGLCPTCRLVLATAPLGPWRPDPCPRGLPPLLALAAYEGPVKRLVLTHKERGRLGLSAPLGVALARVAAPLVGSAPTVLCPVPSSPGAVRERGYDHALRLARSAARALRADGRQVVAAHLLAPARRVADQAGLTAEERAANLRLALRARPLPTARVVLLDDLVTTGATLEEAARALAAHGHRVVGAAVLGATRRRSASGLAVPLHPRAEEG